MNKLLTEFLRVLMEAPQPSEPRKPTKSKGQGMPDNLYAGVGGKYYHDPELRQYAGSFVDNKWTPAEERPEPAATAQPPAPSPMATKPAAPQPTTPAAPQKPAAQNKPAQPKQQAAPAPQAPKPSSDEENPEGTYDSSDIMQKDIVESRNDPQKFYESLDKLGEDEATRMFDKMIAGMGGAVASAGESLCTETQTDFIRGRYKSEEVKSTPAYKKHLDTITQALGLAKARGRAGEFTKSAVQKELAQICIKFGLDSKNGADVEIAKGIFAEAHSFVMTKDEWFTTTPVSKKFKTREDRHSWLRAAFYSAYSLRNNGPSDWNRAENNGRVLKANARTDGVIKQILEDNLKSAKMAGNEAAMKHYQRELEVWRQFKGYHDTYLVYTNSAGLTSVYHISNKKDDELKDPQNNTTPAKRLETYSESAKEAGFNTEQAQIVNTAQNTAIAAVTNIDAIATQAYKEFTPEDIKLIASLSDRLPGKSQIDVRDKYLVALQNDRDIKRMLADMQVKSTELSPDQFLDVASNYAGQFMEGDAGALSGHFSKFIIKVGQLAQSIFDKADKGWTVDEINGALGNNYTAEEIQSIIDSPTMRMLAKVKENHAAGLAGVHRGFIEELHKADGTEIGHSGDNGPAVETYVRGTIKSLHLDTYIKNSDDKIQVEMGGVGVVPKDVRGCMSKLSGFTGETDSPEGRQQLINHLAKRVKVDSSSDAVYLVGEDGKTRTYIASDSWRQAGSAQKVATGFGKHLRYCLQLSVQNRLASK